MKKVGLLLMMVLLVMSFVSVANPVDLSTAQSIGAKFLSVNTRIQLRGANDLQLVKTYSTERGDAALYIFNAPSGFVIVAADDCATPILGYSDEGQLDLDNIPIQMEEYLQGFVEQIEYGVNNNIEDNTIAEQWKTVARTGMISENPSRNAVEPLLTCLWDQGCNYNIMCPTDPSGPCGHVYAGCVATAMGQIMYYWGYPATGSGSHTYNPSGYPQQSINFWETEYDWDNMPDQLTSNSTNVQKEAVGTLLWHCGVAVDMMYGPGGSGTYSTLVPNALKNYFNYEEDLYGQYKTNNAEWLVKIKSNLDTGWPIYYSGASSTGGNGHAFVCDGYNANDYLHFNWGWSGSANGYFSLGAMNASGMSFSYYNYAVFNIHPHQGTETYTVTTETNPVDGGTTTGDGSYNYAQTCTLTATPNENYLFVNWTKNGYQVSTEPTCHVTVKEDATYVANFRRTNVFEVIVGNGNTTSNILPLTASSKYSLTQQIYLADEINAAGPITDVGFYYVGSNGEEKTLSLSLYIKHTEKSSFINENDWDSLTINDLYYTGSFVVDGSTGWKQVPLTTPFTYNGTDNLLICVDDNTGYSISNVYWKTYQNNGRALSVYGDDLNYNPYSPLSGGLENKNNQIKFVFQVTQTTDFIVTPDPVDFGMRPSECWTTPLDVNIRNAGMTTFINSITSSSPYYQVDLNGLTFPLLCEYETDFDIKINSGDGDGPQSAALVINYGNNQTKQVQLLATAYIPAAADTWESATEVTSFPYTEELSSVFRPLYNNYTIPPTDVPDGPDAVYKIVLEEESYLSAAISNGENGKLALYTENFTGGGGPDVDNNFDSNNPLNEWIYYTDEGGWAHVGASGNYYWGIMFPASMLQPYTNSYLSKVAIHESPDNMRKITCNIYLGGDTAPNTLVLTQDFMPEKLYTYHEVQLDNSILIDGTQNLWITFHQVGDMFPASVGRKSDNPNGRWMSLDGVSWMDKGNTNLGPQMFSIKCFITNAYGEQIEFGTNNRNIEQTLLLPGTYYLVASSTSETYNIEIDVDPVICPEPAYGPTPNNGASNIAYESTQLSWNLSEGTTAYKLLFGTTPNCERALVPWTENLANSYIFTDDLDWNTTYYWKVCEKNGTCPNGTESPIWSFTTKAASPYPRIITAEVYPSGGAVSGAGNYTDGSTCTLTAIPASGYVFKRWTEDGTTLSTDNTYSFEVHGNRNLVAVFASTANISFADSYVKDICVSNWDKDGDGELSYSEAADVIEIIDRFISNKNITSFNEFEHFTQILSIDYRAFYGCENLKSIVIPRFVSIFQSSPFPDESPFTATYSLETIRVAAGNPCFDSRNNCNAIINTKTNQLIVGCKNTTVKNTVTSIGPSAFSHCKNLSNIYLPISVTSIGDYAFSYCTSLTSLNIRESLTSIGEYAFTGCQNLSSFIWHDANLSIGDYAFSGCGFTSVTIPSTVVGIGVNPFANCKYLEQITVSSDNPYYDSRNDCNAIIGSDNNELISACINTVIPNTVTRIGKSAFSSSSIITIEIPNSVTSIGSSAFYDCGNLSYIDIPSSVTVIEDNAFCQCSSLTEISIPNGVTAIDNATFKRCSHLSMIDIPNSVETIGQEAFFECGSLTDIIIPNSVSSIGHWAFYNCSNLNNITVMAQTPPTIERKLFYNDDLSLKTVHIPCGTLSDYQSANGWNDFPVYHERSPYTIVVTPSDPAFGSTVISQGLECTDPTAIVIATPKIDYEFANWTEDGVIVSNDAEYQFVLVSDRHLVANFVPSDWDMPIIFADSLVKSICVAHWDTNEDGELSVNEAVAITNIGTAFQDSNITTFDELYRFRGVTSLPNYAFSGCGLLSSVTIPEHVNVIGNFAFSGCSSLTSIIIPSTTLTLGEGSFENCSSITSITIPRSVQSIGQRVFSGCDALEQIIVEIGNLNYDSRDNCNAIIKTGSNALYAGCKGTVIPNTVTDILSDAFYKCSGLTSFNIPNSVYVIQSNAFVECQSLTSITIGSHVFAIGYNLFDRCDALESIVVDPSNGALDSRDNCNAIIQTATNTLYAGCKTTTIPESVTAIANKAFYECVNLHSINMPNTITSIGYQAFQSSGLSDTLVIPNSVTYIGREAFEFTGITSVSIPNSLTNIEIRAFYNCQNLTTIDIPNSVTSIGNSAFRGCSSLSTIILPNSLLSIGNSAFRNCNNISNIFIRAEIPPTMGTSVFGNVLDLNIPVQVPCGSSAAYRNANVWSSFTNYHESPHILMATNSDPLFGYVTIDQMPDCQSGITKVNAIPYLGCSFLNWTIDDIVVSTDAEYEFVVDSDTHIDAHFTTIEDWNLPIVFADAIVKDLCVSNWDTNGDGELSRYEAVAVNNIENVFQNNNEIFSFEELHYFTGLTSLSYMAFNNCTNLRTVTIPNTVTIIKGWAFANCSSLESVTIPNSVTTIEELAFTNCSSLESIVIPNSVTSIEYGIFEACAGLTSATLPDSITSLPSRVFNNCSHLKSIIIPNAVTSIGLNIFSQCYDLEYVVLPKSLVSIGVGAFNRCYGLSFITILAETPPTLSYASFDEVNMNIPVYVPCGCSTAYQTDSSWNPFTNFIESSYVLLVSSSNSLLGTAIVVQEPDCQTNYATVKAIPGLDCRFVNWTINGEVVSAEVEYSFSMNSDMNLTANFETVGDWDLPIEFEDPDVKALCVENWDTNGDGELSRNEAIAITDIGTVFNSHDDINYFDELKYFTGLTSLGYNALLGCHYIERLTIPTNINLINQSALSNCQRLNTLTVMSMTPPKIWSNTVANIPSDVNIIIPCGTSELYRSTSVWGDFNNYHEMFFYELSIAPSPSYMGTTIIVEEPDCSSSQTVVRAVPALDCEFVYWTKDGEIVSTEQDYAFEVELAGDLVAHFITNEDWTTPIVFEDTVVKAICIENWDTNGDGELSRNEAAAVTDLGLVFRNNKNITTFNELQYFTGLTTISNHAFYNCKNLTSVMFPATVTSLDNSAFYNCKFTSIYIPGTLVSVNGTSFYCCRNIEEIIVSPDNVIYDSRNNSNSIIETATNKLIYGCENSIIPESVCIIGESAFYGCSITSVVIPSTVNSILSYAFASCYNISSLTVLAETPPTVSNNSSLGGIDRSIPVYIPCGTSSLYQNASYWDSFSNLYEILPYELNVISSDLEKGTVSIIQEPSCDRDAIIQASPNEGYVFTHWTKNATLVSTEMTYTFTLNENTILVAHFLQEGEMLEVTSTSNPTDGGTITGVGNYNFGETCTLTATANYGYTFQNWTKDGEIVSTEAEYRFNVTESAEYVANFDIQSFVVIASSNPSDGGDVIGMGTYNYGTTCTLTATPNEGYSFMSWSCDGVYVSSNTTYSFTVTENRNIVANFMEGNAVTQSSALSSGWNWYSTYIELSDIDGLAMLEEQLGENAESINSQTSFTMYYGNYGWYGSLTSINNESMYRIKMSSPTTINMMGMPVNPADHPVTVTKGWNHIGYLSSEPMAVDDALAGLESAQGDIVKNQSTYAQYYAGYGWYGSLSLSAISPGQGLMYKSVANESKTFTYPANPIRSSLANYAMYDLHWTGDMQAYPTNMTMMAVVELDGEEVKSEDYELSAFADGKCRGSVRLQYVEPIDRHVAFLTISGDEDDYLYFGLYNRTSGSVNLTSENRIVYHTDDMIGGFETPYVVRFSDAEGGDIKVYPNPVKAGESLNIVVNESATVEIVNALGEVVAVEKLTGNSALRTPATAGVYMLRIITADNNVTLRRVVIE